MDQVYTEFRDFIRKHLSLVGWVVMAAATSYGFSIVNVSISIDEEIHLNQDSVFAWAQQGRWGITLIKSVFGVGLPLPFFQPFVAAIILALSSVAWSFVLLKQSHGRLEKSPWLTLFAVLYLTMPCQAYFFSFNTYNVEISFGSLLSATAVMLSFSWSASNAKPLGMALLAIACSTLAISIYQSFVVVIVCAVVLVYLVKIQTDPSNERSVAVALSELAVTFAPLGFSYICYRLVQFLFVSKTSYADSFLNWGNLDNIFIIKWLYKYVLDLWTGSGFVGGFIIIPLICVGGLTLVLFFYEYVRHRRPLECLAFLIVLISPFVLSFGLGTAMPNRTQQILPVTYSALVLFFVLQVNWEKRFRVIAVFASLLAVAWNGAANTKLFFSEYLTFQKDSETARFMVQNLYEAGWSGSLVPLVVVGVMPNVDSRVRVVSETIGASFFAWGGGERVPIFMSVLGYSVKNATVAQKRQAFVAAELMPIWPKRGSVIFSDGVAIVKLGNATPDQLISLKL